MADSSNEFFQIITCGKLGALQQTLAQTGLPLHRATGGSDVIRAAQQQASFVIIDDAEWSKITREQWAPIENAAQNRVKVFVLGNLPADDRVAHVFAPGEAERAEALAPLLVANQRAAARVQVSYPARFIGDDDLYEGHIHSLSEGGVLFVAAKTPAVGAKGELVVSPQQGEAFTVSVSVVNARKMENGAGMKFEFVPGEVLMRIRAALALAQGQGVSHQAVRQVLVLDASPLMQRLLIGMLEGAGFKARATSQPGELARWLAEPADLVIIDPLGSNVGGDRLKEIVKRAGKAAVVLHGSGSDAQLQQLVQAAGAAAHIRKGMFADLLVGKLNAVFLKPR